MSSFSIISLERIANGHNVEFWQGYNINVYNQAHEFCAPPNTPTSELFEDHGLIVPCSSPVPFYLYEKEDVPTVVSSFVFE